MDLAGHLMRAAEEVIVSTMTTSLGHDQIVCLDGLSWSDFESILAIRGDRGGVRMHFLRGRLELMSPSGSHESIKKGLARLVETYAEEAEIDLNGFGAWLLKNAPKKAGAEPDECYVLGKAGERPDFVIEVVWSHWATDRFEIYRHLGVRELWRWIEGRLEMYELRGEGYEPIERSLTLPGLDVPKMMSFLDPEQQTGSVRRWRAWLHESRG